jgi:flavodoxin
MSKAMIAYFTAGGTTEKMAQYISEGFRIGGHDVMVKEINDIKSAADLTGYQGYIFGSPTYSLDVPDAMKTFLSMVQETGVKGKLAGTFGPYTHDVAYRHDTHAPAIMLDTVQAMCGMKPFELGPLILREDLVETVEGMKACQDYGKIFGEKLG